MWTSLTSRMTSDSYNVQSFAQAFQTICVRAPIMLVGGIIVTLTIDPVLSSILCIMVPILLVVVLSVSRRGIPLYNKVQTRLDDVTRVLRENITGIRVIKALSKTEYETERFRDINQKMTDQDMQANTFMAIPGPSMQLSLNIGLTLVVLIGAYRVNAGLMKPGVILAFLTYFNLIMMSVMALNRIFMMTSKASASADRIALVLAAEDEPKVIIDTEPDSSDAYIHFDHVSFSYNQDSTVSGIDMHIKKGEHVVVAGESGAGKSTAVKLLLSIFQPQEGKIYLKTKNGNIL